MRESIKIRDQASKEPPFGIKGASTISNLFVRAVGVLTSAFNNVRFLPQLVDAKEKEVP